MFSGDLCGEWLLRPGVAARIQSGEGAGVGAGLSTVLCDGGNECGAGQRVHHSADGASGPQPLPGAARRPQMAPHRTGPLLQHRRHRHRLQIIGQSSLAKNKSQVSEVNLF